MAERTIGRYEILQDLGQGGMAIVYLARDPYINRQVAIKVLPRQFTFDPQFRARFKREAESIATLEHAAIVPVYDYGEHDEQPYIVMRYMPGGTLQERMGKLETRTEVAPVLTRMAEALDEAHARGIVHRDLKPSNVLFDGRGVAYLSDFGIAKLTETSAAYTGSVMLGTPAYMSPEQARGERDLDGRSDIYSLGVLLFEMLAGQKPYQADTPMGMAVKHVTEPVPSILAAKPDLPPGYEKVITRALAKDRADRYPTAIELAQAVIEVLAGAPTLTPALKPVTPAVPESLAPAAPPAPLAEAPIAQPTVAAPIAQPTVAASIAQPTVAAQPAPTPVRAPRPAPSRPWIIPAVIGLSLLAVLLVGGGAFAASWFASRATATPTAPPTAAPTVAATAPPTAVPPTLTEVVVPNTATSTGTATATLTATTAATGTAAATATLTATPSPSPTRTRQIVTAGGPTATKDAGDPCLDLPSDQQADCHIRGTAEESARQTQDALDQVSATSEPP